MTYIYLYELLSTCITCYTLSLYSNIKLILMNKYNVGSLGPVYLSQVLTYYFLKFPKFRKKLTIHQQFSGHLGYFKVIEVNIFLFEKLNMKLFVIVWINGQLMIT